MSMSCFFKKMITIAFLVIIGIAFFACNKNGAGDSDTPDYTPGDTAQNQTPVASDYDIGNLTQLVGNITPVTITPKAGKSTGTITIFYNGSTNLPAAIGTYAVTFNVAAATGWNAASGLAGGTLLIDNKINAQTPVITSQPTGGTVTINTQHSLSVSANSPDSGTLSYQWYSNTSASNTGGIFTGVTTANYNPPTNVTGTFFYYVQVTNTIPNNGDGGIKTVTISSNAVSLIVNDKVNARNPEITGQPVSGSVIFGGSYTLSVTANSPDSGALSYQWYSNTSASNSGGSIISGATSASYNPPTDAVGTFYYFVEVKNTIYDNGDGGNKTVAVNSAAVSITVELPPLTGTVSITGTAQVGQTLTANTSLLNGSGTISYQWMRGGTNVGTNSMYYSVQSADVGSIITLAVRRTNNSGSVISPATATVIDKPVLTGTVSITGTAQVGQTLTANTSFLNGSGTISYQWMRGVNNIGTNSNSYTVQTTDIGSTITITVTRTDNSGSVTSTPTANVINPLTGTVTIIGTAHVGRILTVDTNSLAGTGNIIYEWRRGNTIVQNDVNDYTYMLINNNNYLVQSNDSNSTITVTVTRDGYTGSITSTPTVIIPFQIPFTAKKISVGQSGKTVVAIRSDGSLWTWGYLYNIGTLTVIDEMKNLTPTRIGTDTNWALVSAAASHAVAIKTDGSLWAWGRNWSGELGDGTTVSKYYVPIRIGTDSDWASVSTNGSCNVAIKKNGSLWAWGNNSWGQLGDGSTTNKNSPTRIGTDTNWASVSNGGSVVSAIKTDGTLWVWGDDTWGSTGNGIGDGTIVRRVTSPTQVGMATDWESVSVNGSIIMAIKKNGTLWQWGYGSNTPLQIGTDTNWAKVSAGDTRIAIKKDHSLWAWGSNVAGQFGNGTTSGVFYSSPVRIGTDMNWEYVHTGYYFTVAIKTDDGIWTWGLNNDGCLGDSTNNRSRYTPAQINFTP